MSFKGSIHGATLFICLCLLRPVLADNANDQDKPSHPWMVEIHYIPALEIWPDKDLDEEHEGVEMDVDLDTGHGYAVRAAYSEDGLHPQLLHTSSVSLGVFYLNSHHTNKQDQTKAQAHLVLLDAAYEKMLCPQISGNIGLGVGSLIMDYQAYHRNDSGAALMVRGGLNWRPASQCALQAGLGWFYWGYPTETIGSGLFGTLGGTFQF